MNRPIFSSLLALSGFAFAAHGNVVPTVKTQIADQTIYTAATATISLTNAFDDPDSTAVRLSTLFGDIDLQLFGAQKPITVANFLKYVDEGRYFKTDPTTHHRALSFIHRSIPNFIIQGGGFIGTVNPSNPSIVQPTQVTTLAPIQNEPGIFQ